MILDDSGLGLTPCALRATPKLLPPGPLTRRNRRGLMGVRRGRAGLLEVCMMPRYVVDHGFQQMSLRRKWWLQEPHQWGCDVSGAISHEYRGPTLTECAAYAVQLLKRYHG